MSIPRALFESKLDIDPVGCSSQIDDRRLDR